ncbi:MAG TPA: DIP1984 family protein [Ktedonobacterales bacterium]|nr:DIP1984 family protein [Ktedonobacterales bacterium]
MKLAEALIARGDIQKRLTQLQDRLQRSSWVQEGEKPHEDPARLRHEIAGLVTQLQTLIFQINQANISTRLDSGETLTEALAQRDAITLHQNILRSVADAASERVDRYGRAEIRRVPTVDVALLREEIDALAKQRREIDVRIQARNWETELPE